MPFVKVRPAFGKNTITDFRNYPISNVEVNKKEKIDLKQLQTETKLDDIKCPGKDFSKTSESIISMQTLWKEFTETTTMHGLRHARKESKYQLRWVIWIFALIGMGSLLIYTVYTLYVYYRTNPTLTNINIKFVKAMNYPAVTICNMSPLKRTSINASAVMTTHLLHSSRLGVVLPHLNYSSPAFAELNDPVPEDWLNKSSFDLEDMFHYCVNERHLVPCKDILIPKITQWGKCFTFNNYQKVATNGIVKGSMTGSTTALTFYIDVKQDEYVYSTNLAAGVKIVLHDPEEEPDVNNKGFILSPGISTYVSMKMTKYKYLPAPYKAGGDQYCIDVNSADYVNPLKYYPYYSRAGCLLECRRNYIVEKCGCRAVTDPGNETLCTPAQTATCYYQHEVEFDSSGELKEQCECQISCEFTTFDQSISTALFPADVYYPPLQQIGYTDIKNTILEARLYYDSLSYLFVESIPEYNPEDIVGILGGQMGIFLGASLLTVSELLEFVILAVIVIVRKFCCSAFRKKEKLVDHELTPYN
ncbi:acid-sensing ion channel 2-like [Mytilus edulis]|uniref:acid-sensing ion channel 2-like n=1 Tax=Mytilus edulis TaxID=6550 RepID=UPI0039EE4C42